MPDVVPGEVKNKRAATLEKQAEETASAFISGLIGSTRRVLVEEIRDGYAEGYTDSYVKIYIKDKSAEADSGEFCDVKLVEAFGDGILAEPV